MKNIPAEQLMFTWEDWVRTGTAAFTFYDCTVVSPFGPYVVGDNLANIDIDYETGRIECYNEEDESVFKGRILISVVPE